MTNFLLAEELATAGPRTNAKQGSDMNTPSHQTAATLNCTHNCTI